MLPNYFVSGILTVIIAVALCIWSIAFVQRRGGGLVLILLSMLLLLTGGGLGPPLIGVILGVAAIRMHSMPRREVRRWLVPLPCAGSRTPVSLRRSRQPHPGLRTDNRILRCIDLVASRCPVCRSNGESPQP